jgi:energy-coupling factor transporter ATP-binding protein EcfA2
MSMIFRLHNFGCIKNFQWEFEPGRVSTMIGPHGVGKTTVLRGLSAALSYARKPSNLAPQFFGQDPEREVAAELEFDGYRWRVAFGAPGSSSSPSEELWRGDELISVYASPDTLAAESLLVKNGLHDFMFMQVCGQGFSPPVMVSYAINSALRRTNEVFPGAILGVRNVNDVVEVLVDDEKELWVPPTQASAAAWKLFNLYGLVLSNPFGAIVLDDYSEGLQVHVLRAFHEFLEEFDRASVLLITNDGVALDALDREDVFENDPNTVVALRQDGTAEPLIQAHAPAWLGQSRLSTLFDQGRLF